MSLGGTLVATILLAPIMVPLVLSVCILKHHIGRRSKTPSNTYTSLGSHPLVQSSHTVRPSRTVLATLVLVWILLFCVEFVALDMEFALSYLWSTLNPVLVVCFCGGVYFDKVRTMILTRKAPLVRPFELALVALLVTASLVGSFTHQKWNTPITSNPAQQIWNLIHSRGSIPVGFVLFALPSIAWLCMLRWRNALLSSLVPACFASTFLFFKHACALVLSNALSNESTSLSDTLLIPAFLASLFCCIISFVLMCGSALSTLIHYQWIPAFVLFCVETSALNFFFGMLVLDEWEASSSNMLFAVSSTVLIVVQSVTLLALGVATCHPNLRSALRPLDQQRDREFLMHVSNLDLGEFDDDDDDDEAFLASHGEELSVDEDFYDHAPLEIVQETLRDLGETSPVEHREEKTHNTEAY